MSADCPLARSEGLIIEELDGELLVYDSESNMAHALDPQVVAVWRACDGHSDTHALATGCETSEEKVRDTLARLGELGLLEGAQADQNGDTRRVALRKIGIAGVGVATISSILVPGAAAQGSCQPGGTCVSSADQCCNGQTAPRTGLCPPGQENFCLCPPGQENLCCIQAGFCAVGLFDLPPAASCCSGTGVLDSNCIHVPGSSGFRCS
jgi:hypothetical protein